jgi:hypothetical protein
MVDTPKNVRKHATLWQTREEPVNTPLPAVPRDPRQPT